ncbi:F-box only protein 15 isoform X6 [Scyliorhinus torazame]|uniref:F-box only protein 15 isoform X6 n=1 Tax=Scyliorhinus torazame TaxID=75743 RepID=UPI003B5AFEB2
MATGVDWVTPGMGVEARGGGRLEATSFGQKWNTSMLPRSFQLAGAKGGKLRSASLISIESLPWEILQQIFYYLDISSLLCAGCVSKSFYQVSNDNLIWHQIYCKYFACKRKAWKPKTVDTATEKLSKISILDSPAGFWKKEYIRKCAALGTRGVGQLLKPINRYTGLPSKLKEAVKTLGITWMVVLRERNGKEHVKEQSKAYFSDTSATLCWNSAVWPPLSSLKVLCVYGVTPLLHPSKTATNGQYSPPPHEPVLDDIDPEYGLHGYHCHITLHNGKSSYMSGSFHNLFCRKESIQNGFLRMTVISSKKESQHSTISGNISFPWNTEFLKGNIQHCCLMDVTILDEAEKPFWWVSSPVAMHPDCTPGVRYSYLGKRQAVDYKDGEGKVHMELMWLEEENQYYIVNLVLFFTVKKINAWFSTNY